MTKEEIYEANRPKFHDWGTLKDMCLASMQQYADQECAASKTRIEELDKELDLVHLCLTDLYNLNIKEVTARIQSCLNDLNKS